MDELFYSEADEAGAGPAGGGVPPEWAEPLAARMRPRTLEEYVGQAHMLGPGRLLRRAVEADRFTSLIFYGPPGSGQDQPGPDHRAAHPGRGSSTSAGWNRAWPTSARRRKRPRRSDGLRKRSTILFVDEIHRFNKAQQDVLLPSIERGTVRFIGATTHNPFFYLNSPLVSRSQIFQLEPIPEDGRGRAAARGPWPTASAALAR